MIGQKLIACELEFFGGRGKTAFQLSFPCFGFNVEPTFFNQLFVRVLLAIEKHRAHVFVGALEHIVVVTHGLTQEVAQIEIVHRFAERLDHLLIVTVVIMAVATVEFLVLEERWGR